MSINYTVSPTASLCGSCGLKKVERIAGRKTALECDLDFDQFRTLHLLIMAIRTSKDNSWYTGVGISTTVKLITDNMMS